ncbi:MAG: maleylpyruvate isomerase family mycothiol-dependent enzyme [Actinobacteria bacterium]|nr:maleylpyruvate isomerase family mycothiol-dependent enzyme [Actinomycetota bacterium]
MERGWFLAHIEAAVERMIVVARSLSGGSIVPSYPSHTVASLVGHVADVAERVDRGLSEGVFDRSPPKPLLHDLDEAIALLSRTSTRAIEALRRTSAQAPLVHAFTALPATASMYPCYLAVEVLIHRWDIETVSGMHEPIDAELAVVAIDNLFDAWFPMRRADTSGVARPVRVQIELLDHSRSWTVSAAPDGLSARRARDVCDAQVRGTAADLMLLLWKRVGVNGQGFERAGTFEAIDQLLSLSYVPDPQRH